ncbi:YbaB/EbfC family nucleoid-associated protein [Nocardia brevicatena]|uniref:YbaB/EbfC family nucleoid-associated protein n=1 Tax=Nocardia brevicatena TaxID=37327 RepID=UPI001C3F1B9C|nr:YbaB/EbfC family nucleoid-associated protein [Nocardia brevicatena]
MDAFERQQQQVAEGRASASSSDGGVEVTVDSVGAVLEVRVTPAAMRVTAEQPSGTITAVARKPFAGPRSRWRQCSRH